MREWTSWDRVRRLIIYSPNWSISLCGAEDTCGPAPRCDEHLQAHAEIQTCSAWMLNLRCTAGVGGVCGGVCLGSITSDKQVVRLCIKFHVCFCEVFLFMWLYTWLIAKQSLPDVSTEQPVMLLTLHVWLSAACLYLCLITPVPLHCSQPRLWRIADTGSQHGRVCFSLTGHISAPSSLTADSTSCPSLRASPAALF